MVEALGERGGNPLGHRRNHSREWALPALNANGAASRFSTARRCSPRAATPLLACFAIAVGNPDALDVTGRVKSMAVRIVAPNGQEWRSGMNNSPVFVVSNPRDF